MRTKDFRFLTINTESLWEAWERDHPPKNLDITAEGLSLHRESVHVFRESFRLSSMSTPMDFAVDECGVLYILDAGRCNVLIYDPNTELSEWLECFGGCGSAPGKFCDPGAITLSPSNIYIADACNNRIQAFARINLQIRWLYSFAAEMKPVDLALDGQENLYVLVLNTAEPESFSIQRFDRAGCWSDIFAEGLENVTHLTVGDDSLYVLRYVSEAEDGRRWQVLKFRIEDGALEETIDLSAVIEGIEFSGLTVDGWQNLYVGGKPDTAEERGFLYRYNHDPSGEMPPERRIQVIAELPGACDRLGMDREGNLYVLDAETGEITFLEFVQIFSRNEKGVHEGTYISDALDSGVLGLKWHKIVVDSQIPERTQITVSYYISDEPDLPSEPLWSKALLNPRDALILSSQGRYLWLKITLFGDEQHTPGVKSVSAYFPRLSYLRYLPAIYQEDEASRDFLERFLSLFESFFFDLEEEIFSVTKYFDVNAAPTDGSAPERDFLTWLASWLAVAFDENWTAQEKQEFLKAVPELYRKRGTREGLQDFIRIYTGKDPIIVEHFQLGCLRDEAEEIKRIWGTLFGDCLYYFCVLLLPEQVKTESRLNTVRRIVQAEKPAHTTAGVRMLQPWIYLDMHSYLGINSVLSKPVFRLGQTSAISRDTVLSDQEKGGQMERHARMGVDTILT